MVLAIEITKVQDGWRVWFGTWVVDRSRTFKTPEEADSFAKEKFAKSKNRPLLYPKDWPLP